MSADRVIKADLLIDVLRRLGLLRNLSCHVTSVAGGRSGGFGESLRSVWDLTDLKSAGPDSGFSGPFANGWSQLWRRLLLE
jgi:hypothetical protein